MEHVHLCLCAVLVPLFAACGGGTTGTGTAPDPGPPQTVSLDTFQIAAVVIGQVDPLGSDPNQGGAADANTCFSPGGVAVGSLFIADTLNNRVLGFASAPTTNNAAADFVLGQPDFTTVDAIGAPSPTKFNRCTGVCVADGRLFMASSHSNRVVIWNMLPTATGTPPDVVIGQPDLGSDANALSQTGLNEPQSVCVGGGKVVVGDNANNRVMIWNSVPAVNNAPADIVLGQAAFNTSAANVTQTGMSGPWGVWTDGTRVVVADSASSRVLIWNSFPTMNAQPADVVLGQADFVSGAQGGGASGLAFPAGVCSNGTQLFVADTGNNRVLIWNAFPVSNGQPADLVLGQGDFVHLTANDSNQDDVQDPAPSLRSLQGPSALAISGPRLFVADRGNHRVLVFNGN